jgi:hypothetical protein
MQGNFVERNSRTLPIDCCFWPCDFPLFAHRGSGQTNLVPGRFFGIKKHIIGLIGRRTVHIANIFNKTHRLSLQNPTPRLNLRETKHDAVEDINNPNCFVKAIHELRGNCSPLQKRVFTLKTCKKEKNRLHSQGLKSYYFDPRSSRALETKSVSAFLDELSEKCGFGNPGDGRPTFYGCRRLGITRMTEKGVTAS